MSESRVIGTFDPLVLQAEKILAQRQTRNLVIDPDLLGEPGWDILLSAFIAGGKGTACRVDEVAHELHMPLRLVQRWVALLADRDMVEARDNLIVLTNRAEMILREMFKKQMADLVRELRAIRGELKAANN